MNQELRIQVVPELQNGDHQTRDEFERRDIAMPVRTRAELIEGVVYRPSPVRFRDHGRLHIRLTTWLGCYQAATPGTDAGADATVRLDLDNEPQPDGILFIESECGGQVQISADDYTVGAPNLTMEVAASSVSIDLGLKKKAYMRNRVREYIVLRVYYAELDWFILRNGEYGRLFPDAAGIIRSETFPGLWLDVPALIRRDMAQVLAVLQQGLASPEHAAFVETLRNRAPK